MSLLTSNIRIKLGKLKPIWTLWKQLFCEKLAFKNSFKYLLESSTNYLDDIIPVNQYYRKLEDVETLKNQKKTILEEIDKAWGSCHAKNHEKKLLYDTFFYKMYIYIFFFQKNTIENRKFNFLTRICEIRNKRKNPKLFASIRSINFYLFDIVSDKMYIFCFKFKKFNFLNKICPGQKLLLSAWLKAGLWHFQKIFRKI